MDHHHHQQNQTTFPTPSNQTRPETESDRLLSIAEKLLQTRDLSGSRDFALLAQETESLSENSDQILAISDVLLASEKRVINNRQYDWYSILQSDRRSEPDLIKKNYRRLALLLHPDKNKYPLADSAFKLVSEAWSVLSDSSNRISYDNELLRVSSGFEKDKLPIRRGAAPTAVGTAAGTIKNRPRDGGEPNFWTTCPYCYCLYEYPKMYMECCIRCQNCDRAFHAVAIQSLPPMVPGKEAYYCCWGFFPLGFSLENGGIKGKNLDDNPSNTGFPNWTPDMFNPASGSGGTQRNAGFRGVVDFSNGSGSGGVGNVSVPGAKKRGRPPKKN